jgi:two-component system cell cycle sensor histidine kinase/response regulator CckA
MALDHDGPYPAELLLAALSDAALTVDGAGRVTGCNAAAVHRFGFDGDAAAGRRPEDLAGGPISGAVRLPLEPGGAYRELIVWPDGGLASTDMIRLQREDAMGRLAGGISHDLNNMASIVSLASMLDGDPAVPVDLQDTARLLRREAERTLRIIRGLLEVARHRQPSVASIALGPLVRESIELAGYALIAVDVRVSVPDALPHVEVDAYALRQAILAITINAIEAMGGQWVGKPQASGRLRVIGRTVDDEAGVHVRLSFEDAGPPVPVASQPFLFADDPPAATPRAGRDLAAARALIASFGGRLAYEALPDGNRFVVELPVAGRAETAPGPARRAVTGGGLAAGAGRREPAATLSAPAATAVPQAAGLPAGTVLICDDEAYIRVLLVRVIEKAGYRVLEAAGGLDALDQLEGESVDLIIADQRMAGMTGIELYHAVSERHPDLRSRFVLMSGDPSGAELVSLAAETGIGVLGTPFDFGRVEALVRETIGT